MINFLLDAGTQVNQNDPASSVMFLVVMLISFAIFYFFVIRPQRKKDKELKKQINDMSVGDKIITIGGLVGVLASINDDEVTIYTSVANTPVTFQKNAINTIIPRNSDKPASKEKKDKKKSDDQ